MLPAQPQVTCAVYRKESKVCYNITPINVVRRSDGTLYVITRDELATIKALGLTHREYAESL